MWANQLNFDSFPSLHLTPVWKLKVYRRKLSNIQIWMMMFFLVNVSNYCTCMHVCMYLYLYINRVMSFDTWSKYVHTLVMVSTTGAMIQRLFHNNIVGYCCRPNTPPENKHGTWKYPLGKGETSTNQQFWGSMFVFGDFGIYCTGMGRRSKT